MDRVKRWALGLQSLCVLLLTGLGHGELAGVLLAVVAGQAPLLLPMRAALGYLVFQTWVFCSVLLLWDRLSDALFAGVGFAGFQLFAAGAAWLARRESEARLELSRVHAELLATQSLLADGTRNAERLRISRELHDSLGHHLTALNLQLEVARNTTSGNEAVQRARQLASEMLGEVRSAVGSLRDERTVDLAGALATLVSGIPAPRVVLEVSPDLHLEDAELGHALFRAVQEGLTNVLRHAQANTVWVTVSVAGACLTLELRDDGRGARGAAAGNGLLGLQERFEELGGRLVRGDAPEGGFRLHVEVPRKGRAG